MAEELKFNVKTNIDDAAKDAEKLGDNIEKAKDQTEGLEGATKKGAGGFKKMGMAVKGFGLALKAAGIGLIIAAFVALKEALGRNQKVMNTVNTVMTTISTTFNQVVDVIVDVVKWVTESSDRFDGLTKVISGLMTLAITPLKLSFYAIKLGIQGAMLAWEDSFLGGGDVDKIAKLREDIADTKQDILDTGKSAIDAGKDIYENFNDAVSEIGAIYEKAAAGIGDISIKANLEQAKATTVAKNNALLAAAEIQGLIEKYDRQAELQRQIRDDETKTFAERIAANKELGRILEEQEKEMLKQADIRISAAALELAANKDNIELQVAYKEAVNERAAVEAQVAGFRSEQMTNQVGLEKELGEAKNEVLLAGLENIELELSELARAYELKLEMARKAGEDTKAITEQYEKEKADIIKTAAEELEDFKKDLQMKAFKLLGSHLDASMSELEGNYSKEKRLAEANGQDTTAIDEKYEAKRVQLAKQQKAFKIAEALITTYQMASLAYKDGLEAGGPAGLILGPVAAGIAVLAGLANVRSIMAQDVGGGGGGSVSAPSATPRTTVASGAFTLEGGVEPEPARAYVVSDDITDSQNKLANIRRRATI